MIKVYPTFSGALMSPQDIMRNSTGDEHVSTID